MKAFSDRGNGDMYKDAFDKAFRSGSGKTENAFVHLKNCWKVLKCFNFTVPCTSQIIVAYCVLHNFCKMNNEQLASGKIMHPHLNLNDLRVSRKPTTEKASRLAAIAIRHAIYEKWFRFYLHDIILRCYHVNFEIHVYFNTYVNMSYLYICSYYFYLYVIIYLEQDALIVGGLEIFLRDEIVIIDKNKLIT